MSETSKKWYQGPLATQQPDQERPDDGLEGDGGRDDQGRLAAGPADGCEERRPGSADRRLLRGAGRELDPVGRSPSRQPVVDLAEHGAEVGERPPLEALLLAALGQVAAREDEVGLARGAEVAGSVAEHEDDVAGAAQSPQDRRLAALRPAARAVAERVAELEVVRRAAVRSLADQFAGEQLDGGQVVRAARTPRWPRGCRR